MDIIFYPLNLENDSKLNKVQVLFKFKQSQGYSKKLSLAIDRLGLDTI